MCSYLGLKNDHLSVVKLLTSLRVDVSAKTMYVDTCCIWFEIFSAVLVVH